MIGAGSPPRRVRPPANRERGAGRVESEGALAKLLRGLAHHAMAGVQDSGFRDFSNQGYLMSAL